MMIPALARRLALAAILLLATTGAHGSSTHELEVAIESNGWILLGDVRVPADGPTRAFAVLLHKASGDRTAYAELAEALASSGIASLRIDLRGHGESTNLGAFDPDLSRFYDETDPAVVANFELIRTGDEDIVSILRWLQKRPQHADLPLVMVGSSYTGEEMTEAASVVGFADVYVALAPGNFSEDSIRSIDASGAPWLFVRAEKEMPFFPALFDSIRAGSETAEIWVIPGEGHATDLLDKNPGLHLRLLEWIEANLPAA